MSKWVRKKGARGGDRPERERENRDGQRDQKVKMETEIVGEKEREVVQ